MANLNATRRQLLGSASALLGVALFAQSANAQPALSESTNTSPSNSKAKVRVSQNGWPIADSSALGNELQEVRIGGTSERIVLRIGDPTTLLVDLAERLNQEVVETHSDDLRGWAPENSSPASGPHSNLLSGTAIQIRPGAATDAYTYAEQAAIREILKSYNGALSWGGDLVAVDQSLFFLSPRSGERNHFSIARGIRANSEGRVPANPGENDKR